MMKFPSASAGGTAPSGNSLAATYPGVRGSRVGGVGRGGRVAAGGVWFDTWAGAGFTPAIKFSTALSSAAFWINLAIFISLSFGRSRPAWFDLLLPNSKPTTKERRHKFAIPLAAQTQRCPCG